MMNLLTQHFKAVRAAMDKGQDIWPLVGFDIDNTLADYNDKPITHVSDFLKWVAQNDHPFLKYTTIITGGNPNRGLSKLDKAGISDIFELSVGGPTRKTNFYERLKDAKAALIIDDAPEDEDLRHVLTHLNPTDDEVRKFFENREYENADFKIM